MTPEHVPFQSEQMADDTDFHAELIHGLLRPEAWPEPVGEIQPIETHISTVLLAGDFAYKIKKPLDLGFLDFSTLERRKHFCEEEIRLNGRLAPHIYLGVTPVTGTAKQPHMDGEGPVIDYAVKMRRFPPDALLSRHPGLLSPERMEEIARIVADFHQRIAVAGPAEGYGTPTAVLAPMLENFRQIDSLLDDAEELARLARLEAWTRDRHKALQDALARRLGGGFIRECHGDMHLGNIALVDGKILIFDGIEFAPGLRWIDTVSEIAFLTMDLEEKGRPDLAWLFLSRYLDCTGDYEGLALLRFYQAYRAMVRAKVSIIRLGQPALTPAQKEAVLADYRAYVTQAEGYTRTPRPALIINHGLSGSGKSTVTAPLLGGLSAVQIRSDVERKRLAGLPARAHTRSGLCRGLYSPRASDETYEHLKQLAETIIEAGHTAIVDATFLKQARRRAFRDLAGRLGVPFLILDFQAPEELLRARIDRRLAEGADPSEANPEVLAAQLASQEALTGSERKVALAITPDHIPDVGEIKQRLVLRANPG